MNHPGSRAKKRGGHLFPGAAAPLRLRHRLIASMRFCSSSPVYLQSNRALRTVRFLATLASALNGTCRLPTTDHESRLAPVRASGFLARLRWWVSISFFILRHTGNLAPLRFSGRSPMPNPDSAIGHLDPPRILAPTARAVRTSQFRRSPSSAKAVPHLRVILGPNA